MHFSIFRCFVLFVFFVLISSFAMYGPILGSMHCISFMHLAKLHYISGIWKVYYVRYDDLFLNMPIPFSLSFSTFCLLSVARCSLYVACCLLLFFCWCSWSYKLVFPFILSNFHQLIGSRPLVIRAECVYQSMILCLLYGLFIFFFFFFFLFFSFLFILFYFNIVALQIHSLK